MTSKLAVTLTFALALLGTGGAGARTAPGAMPRLERAIMKLDAAADRTTLAVPAHLPASAAATGIGPGSHLIITFASEPGSVYGCTANFVWASGTNRYLGAAGHCFVPEDKTTTHGPGADYNPAGTTVKVCVASCLFGGLSGFVFEGTTVALGPVVYARATQGGVDLGNDFGIVQIPSSAFGQIRTSMPVWGGPTSSGTVTTGSTLCLYGNGAGVGETFPTMARIGVGSGANSSRWLANLPSMVGDSGSAVQTCGQHTSNPADGIHGKAAVGVLTHITLGTGIIGGTTMSRAIAMTSSDRGITISALMGS